MAFDKRTLVLPNGTTFEERTIVTRGDVILGNHVVLEFGARTGDGRVFGGAGLQVDGDLACSGDLRLDKSSHVGGNIECGGNVYLGERCFVKGDLKLDGDMDVGDDVKIGGELKAKGWVNKRSPVPLVVYIFIYLLELVRMGKSEEVERILKELEATEAEDLVIGETFLFIPDESKVGLQQSEIKGAMDAGDECRLLGNFHVKGNASLGRATQVFGALRADGDVKLGDGAEVQGELSATGKATIGANCKILGDLKANTVEMSPGATVAGKVVAPGGVVFRTEVQASREETADKNVKAFNSKASELEELLG